MGEILDFNLYKKNKEKEDLHKQGADFEKKEKIKSNESIISNENNTELLDKFTSPKILNKVKEINTFLRDSNFSREAFIKHWNDLTKLNDNELLDLYSKTDIELLKNKPAYLTALNKTIAIRGQQIIEESKRDTLD